MIFTSFKALKGDAFLISVGVNNILVDGGTPNTYGQIASAIDESLLNAVFITHVDYDHIGGIINLINDFNFNLSDCAFYMNHPDLAVEYQGDEVGYKHGDSLQSILKKRNKEFSSLKSKDEIHIGEIVVSVLSPQVNILNDLHNNWNASKVFQDSGMSYSQRQINNGDIINKSSVVLLVTYGSRKILLLGDSHADTVCKVLKENAYSEVNPLCVELLKLSHHGSRHNTNDKMLKLIRCEKFYVSTNGASYGHPDSETIYLLQKRAAELNTVFTVYLNYDIEVEIRDKCSFELKNLEFKQENRLDI
ncbi:MBL fold metallo-hydrolase [Shewanella baltica]|uniref:ComEC/Rec2 family competence protein n=1 Tax=Shewanella baltica TaxID=62322 RepID=UPI00217D7752|nr:MBL fold metallo-hydrolase [Shewanella baltica]MCS6133851.1 MBL fold metallo-hydrolase [Shewanella baltica]